MKRKTLLQWVALLCLLFILVPVIMGEAPKLINLDFKDTDIKDVLRVLANQTKVSIIVDEQTTGTVTIHLAKVTLAEALDVIAKNYNLTCVKSKNVYYVSPLDNSFLKIDYKDGLLSLEARDASVKKVFQDLSQKTGINLIPSPDLKGKISIVISRSPIQDAIKTLLTQSNCIEEKIGKNSYIRQKATQPYSFTVNYDKKLLTVDAKNIPIQVLARAITEKTGISVIPEQSMNDNVSIYFQELPFDEGMEALCQANNFNYYKENQSRRVSRKNGVYRVTYKNSLLSVEATNVEISELIGEISRQSNVNIMLDRTVKGKVTAHFQALPMFQGLLLMVENQGWYIEKQSNCYFVKPSGNENKDARIVYNPDTKRFDLDVSTGSMSTIINEMAKKAGINIVILSQVNWTVSNIRLRNLKFDDALDYLIKGTIFSYKVTNGVYMIGDGLLARPEISDFAEVKSYTIKYLKADQLLNSLPPIFPRQNFVQLPGKNTLVVTGPDSVHKLFENYLKQVDIASAKDETEMIRIKYLKAEDVMKMIPSSIPKNDLVVIKESNAIVATGSPSFRAQVKNFIATIDQVTPLIVFDVAILQIADSDALTWKGPTASIKMPNGNRLKVGGDGSFAVNKNAGSTTTTTDGTKTTTTTTSDALLSLTALVSKGKAKVVSNPTISTLAGYPASFNVSTNKNISMASTKDADGTTTSTTIKEYKSGLFFQIVPWVSQNKQITMEIKPTITDFTGQTTSADGTVLPTISERKSETTIRVADGQTFVISGLKQSRKEKTRSKVPLLGDIPLLGNLFKNTSNSTSQDEYVIVITPTLVYGDADRAKNSQKMQQKYNVNSLMNDVEKMNTPVDKKEEKARKKEEEKRKKEQAKLAEQRKKEQEKQQKEREKEAKKLKKDKKFKLTESEIRTKFKPVVIPEDHRQYQRGRFN